MNISEEPLISVVMPAFNCSNYVEDAIRSILNQTFPDFELLIADDASTDSTKLLINKIALTDQRIKLFHNKMNLGYLKASNLLLEKCKGKYITFQDADDLSDPYRFELLLKAFSQNQDVYCIGSGSLSFKDTISEGIASEFPLSYEQILTDYKRKVVMVGSALMIKREVYLSIGGYHEFFNRIGSEDIYWYGKIIEKFKTINIPESVYFYRQNPNSVSRTNKNNKSLISYELCMHAFQSRLNGKKDVIADGTIGEKEFLCKKLLAEYYIKKGMTKIAYRCFFDLFSDLFKLDYSFFRLFARQTIYNLFRI